MLICAGKRVGAALLAYLIERGDVVSRVIASSAADAAIMDLCRGKSIRCDVYYKGIGKHLEAEGRTYEWLLNFWSPHLIPAEMLNLAERRLNLHPSLVPHARGSDSTAWVLRKHLPAGVSLIEMTETLDAGGVYAQKVVRVPFPCRGIELHSLLQDDMISLFKESWPAIQSGALLPVPQEAGGSYHLRRETNADRVRHENSSATLGDTLNWLLSHDFNPGTTAEAIIDGERYSVRLDIRKL